MALPKQKQEVDTHNFPSADPTESFHGAVQNGCANPNPSLDKHEGDKGDSLTQGRPTGEPEIPQSTADPATKSVRLSF